MLISFTHSHMKPSSTKLSDVYLQRPYTHLVEIKDVKSATAPKGPKGIDDGSDNEQKPEPEILGEKVR